MILSRNLFRRFGQWIKFHVFPHDIYESLRPMLWIFLLIGILPLRISGKRDNHILKSVFLSYLISFIMLLVLIYCYLSTVSLDRIFLSYFRNHSFATTFDRLLITMSLFGNILVFVKNIRCIGGFVRIIQRLHDADDLLRTVGHKMRHGRTTSNIILRLTIGTSAFFVYVAVSYYLLQLQGRRTYLTTWISYFVPLMMLMLVFFNHTTVMHLFVRRFAGLGEVSEM